MTHSIEAEAKSLVEGLSEFRNHGGDVDTSITDSGALLSIAISMKRIADALTLTPMALDEQQAPANIRSLLCELVDNTRGSP